MDRKMRRSNVGSISLGWRVELYTDFEGIRAEGGGSHYSVRLLSLFIQEVVQPCIAQKSETASIVEQTLLSGTAACGDL